MGKKSRRNNRKTGNNAATATASASATAANSASSGTNQCFHGSTDDNHPKSEYMKAVEEYLDMLHQVALLDNQDGSKDQQLDIYDDIYDEDHMHLIEDPEFHRFIFAFCTELYLESNNLKDQSRSPIIKVLLPLGLRYRYTTNPDGKLTKYVCDILTDRGTIKVLVCETRTHCKCMNEGKVIAKGMDLIGICCGCLKYFPKETLSFCSGCQVLKYHNRKCQLDHWHIHKSDCGQP